MHYILRRLLGLFVIGSVLAIFWVLFSALPLWKLHQVIIRGNGYISEQVILSAAQIPKNSSIFKISTMKINRRLAALPWVDKVQVTRKLPNKLIIQIKPKKVAYRVLINDSSWFIDRKGNILNREDLILQNNLSHSVYGLTSISDINKMLEDLNPLIDQMETLVTGNLIINYSPSNISVVSNGLLIKIGVPILYQEKLSALKNMLKVLEPKLEKIEYIDIRAYKTPAVKFKSRYGIIS